MDKLLFMFREHPKKTVAGIVLVVILGALGFGGDELQSLIMVLGAL